MSRSPCVLVLLALLLASCSRATPTAPGQDMDSNGQDPAPGGSDTSGLPASQTLSALPVDAGAVRYISPYGGDHNGFDFGTVAGGAFFSVGDGIVTRVEINTGQGLPGTNYRIMIDYSQTIGAEYHFEIDGSIPDDQQRASILVSEGGRVSAGQHIGSLASQGGDAHVHFGVYVRGDAGVVACPTEYFSAGVAAQLQDLWTSGAIEQRPSLPNLCN